MDNKLLKDLIKFSKKIKGSKLKDEVLKGDFAYMSTIDNHFETTRIQSIILVAVFQSNSEGDKPSISDLANFFKCNTMELFLYKREFDLLKQRGIFDMNTLFSFLSDRQEEKFSVTSKVRNSILENKPFEKPDNRELSPLEITEKIYNLMNIRNEENGDSKDLQNHCNALIKCYEETAFVKYLKSLNLTEKELLTYLYVIGHNINGNLSCELNVLSAGIFDNKAEQIFFEKDICEKKIDLIKYDYLSLKGANFFSSVNVSLTSKSSDELEVFKIPIRLRSQGEGITLIKDNDIATKRLYYNSKVSKELDGILKSLKPSKYRQINKSLKDEGLRLGVCILFYGTPGTGKTESVYQIAKATGRGIWKVDLSELKSKWHGESEKLIKKLFKDYNLISKREKRTPILLLNEADGILGKRKTDAYTSSEKSDNAVQNIFLDCMEDFDGILIATTNLEESLDNAFERRFLFKVHFEKPTASIRAKIWSTKFKGLQKPLALKLASQYDFSGGEIENIVRKYKMAKVIEPKLSLFTKLEELCNSEKFNTKKIGNSIGFKNFE